jgi:site-specific DNA recombinase
MRVLGRVRLSRASEESTSPERQREIVQNWADQNDHEVIGWAEDLDVSGSVDPFDTLALGPWLVEPKLREWDIVCSWKLDRLARRAVPLHRLFGLCQDEGKLLVCVSDNIDLSHWVGRLVASVIAGVAEGELEAIRERTLASHRKLRELGRWSGGRPAYGYRAQEREDAAGWDLVPDEHTAPELLSIIEKVLAGQSVESVARELTDRGVSSPSKRGQWHGQTLRQLLRSKTLLGHVTHQGMTVRDVEGLPIRKGPPLITQAQYDQLQAVLEGRSFKPTRTTKASPLLGVAVCYECEGPMYFRGQTMAGKLYRYYYCRSKHGNQIPADWVEEVVEETFLGELGEQLVMERVFIPAEDHQIELDEAVRAVDELTALAGAMTSVTVRKRLEDRLSALDSRIALLEQLPTRESRWELRETDKTYRQEWESADIEQRRQLLLRSGITAAVILLVGKVPRFDLRIPEDIRTRVAAR